MSGLTLAAHHVFTTNTQTHTHARTHEKNSRKKAPFPIAFAFEVNRQLSGQRLLRFQLCPLFVLLSSARVRYHEGVVAGLSTVQALAHRRVGTPVFPHDGNNGLTWGRKSVRRPSRVIGRKNKAAAQKAHAFLHHPRIVVVLCCPAKQHQSATLPPFVFQAQKRNKTHSQLRWHSTHSAPDGGQNKSCPTHHAP